MKCDRIESVIDTTPPDTLGQTGLVTTVIPACNGALWIEDCIRSVLAQTYGNFQIFVVDDGSRDDTLSLVRAIQDTRLQVITQPNLGVAAARNAGLLNADGEFVAFLDQDDLWQPDKLSTQISYLRAHPHITGVFTDAEECDECSGQCDSYASLHPGITAIGSLLHAITGRDVPLMSTLLVRREFLVRRSIMLDAQSAGVDDIGLFLEILAHGGELAYIGHCGARRRMHAQNQSADHFNRFNRRILMYEGLLRRCADCGTKWTAAVRRALSDAEFRVGEWHWGHDSRAEARLHFQRALRAWGGNWKASRGLLYTLLPSAVTNTLRKIKQSCLGE